MAELVGPPPEVTFTLSITRAATGLVETYDMVGHVIPQTEVEEKEQSNGCNPLNIGA